MYDSRISLVPPAFMSPRNLGTPPPLLKLELFCYPKEYQKRIKKINIKYY